MRHETAALVRGWVLSVAGVAVAQSAPAGPDMGSPAMTRAELDRAGGAARLDDDPSARGTSLFQAQLAGADLTGWSAAGARFEDADLTSTRLVDLDGRDDPGGALTVDRAVAR